jgi:hypothetical protein
MGYIRCVKNSNLQLRCTIIQMKSGIFFDKILFYRKKYHSLKKPFAAEGGALI